MASYPEQWESDVALADGGTVRVRPIRPDDGDRLARFHERQSPESIYFRFFSPRPRLSPRDIERFTEVDYVDRMAFVAILNEDMVGVARYDRHPTRSDAEVAFFIDDNHAGRGMATVLLEYLAAAAREVGITGFTAQVLPQNRRMLGVFKQAGFGAKSTFGDGVIEVELAIEPTDEARAAIELRAKTAEARSVARILAPRSVAVVGASRRTGSIGNVVFRQLIEGGFEGPAYPVNPEASSVASVRSYPSMVDVPDDIDLAVILVPADHVLEVIEDCGHKQVQGLLVISAGFAETGSAGAELEHRVVERARSLGMRMIGPNTMGAINTAPGVRLHASFTDVVPQPGRIGVSSQSGTIGAAVLDELRRHGLGVSTFVATGNKADVSGNDLLSYWEQDERTDMVVLYLESFGNPRNFGRIARRMSLCKPIVAVKSGRTLLDPANTESDGPLVDAAGWPADVTFDALLRQTGVIRVDTLEELIDVSRVLANQPLPSGRRVAIVSNFWGPAVLAADACIAAGLELVSLTEATIAELASQLPEGARTANPLELTALAGPAEYSAAVTGLLADPGVDALLVLHAPTIPVRTAEVARAVAGATGIEVDKPIVSSFLGPHKPGELEALGSLPDFPFPEAAVRALGRVARYAEWRSLPPGEVRVWPEAVVERARSDAQESIEGQGARLTWLLPDEASALLGYFGVAPAAQELAYSADEAVEAATRVGYPVALKATGLERPARTEAEGIAVDVHGVDELVAAYDRMVERHGPAMQPALVQAMVPTGVNLTVGIHQHRTLGSILTVGPVESEPHLRILPLTDRDAERLVARIEGLDAEGAAHLADLLERLSGLAEAVREVAELRLDPVLVSASGAFPTDVRLRLSPWRSEPDRIIRRLA